jgi:hypothetical protein
VNNSLFESNIGFLTNALNLIKKNSSGHYKLIEGNCKKILIFKTNPDVTNSFATINAHGIAFLNVYQNDYDEVFFIDDIAHQTGHIILNTLFHDKKAIFKIDEEKKINEIIKINDYRSIHILIHAFYTYYTTLMCLDDCLKNNSFNNSQKTEAIARIGFYINKCSIDIKLFDKICECFNGIDNVLTSKGTELVSLVMHKYKEIYNEYNPKTKKFDYSNQMYNFAFKNFIELNN